ncbi:MAG: hypothetical protein ACRDRH_27800, partial [Pseudonocardia sp.]
AGDSTGRTGVLLIRHRGGVWFPGAWLRDVGWQDRRRWGAWHRRRSCRSGLFARVEVMAAPDAGLVCWRAPRRWGVAIPPRPMRGDRLDKGVVVGLVGGHRGHRPSARRR